MTPADQIAKTLLQEVGATDSDRPKKNGTTRAVGLTVAGALFSLIIYVLTYVMDANTVVVEIKHDVRYLDKRIEVLENRHEAMMGVLQAIDKRTEVMASKLERIDKHK